MSFQPRPQSGHRHRPGRSSEQRVFHNPSISALQARLHELGADGWELVTSVTTVKTWLNLTGNNLVFVLKKRGLGHVAFADAPSIEQHTYLIELLGQRGFDRDEVASVVSHLQAHGLWSGAMIFEISAEWQTLDRPGIEAWLAEVDRPPA